MAVGLQAPTRLGVIDGVRLGTAALGGRQPPRDDLLVLALCEGTRAEAVFTRNRFCAAPVIVAKEHLGRAAPRYLLVNAGNANAGTGAGGIHDAKATCKLLAKPGGCRSDEALPFSTGVIGERLPVARFEPAIAHALKHLSADGWVAGARAIMTTDTVAKGATRNFDVVGDRCTVTGIAKGSGMICPDMATMLSFVATDAAVTNEVLRQCFRHAVQKSFNAITVDGDTSTNDACIVVATGRRGELIDTTSGAAYDVFAESLEAVLTFLAQAIIRDAEGATKFITVQVSQGRTEDECRRVAYAIAHSPLVMTAMFASDANWGRILAVVGRAGIDDLNVDGVSIKINDVTVAEGGAVAESYTEAAGARAMSGEDLWIEIGLGRGDTQSTVWTSDLSHDYVTINAEYRT